MKGFLGDFYEPVMQLLMTANTFQEKARYFMWFHAIHRCHSWQRKRDLSNYLVPNQMAVMLITGGSPTVIAERVLIKQANQKIAEALPEWPVELQTILDEDALKKKSGRGGRYGCCRCARCDLHSFKKHLRRLQKNNWRQRLQQELQEQLQQQAP